MPEGLFEEVYGMGDKVQAKLVRQAKFREDMAHKLGVTAFTVRRWEKGATKPSRLALRQLARLETKVK